MQPLLVLMLLKNMKSVRRRVPTERVPLMYSPFIGVVYYSVRGQGSVFGSIRRAYIPTFEDYGNNMVKDVDLNLRYIVNPDGLAVDWVGRYGNLILHFIA